MLSFLARHPTIRTLLWGLLLIAMLGCLPLFVKGYWLYVLNLVIIYSIACHGLNMLMGDAGMVSLGHAGFMLIGAYGSAILTATYGLPFWLALIAGATMAAVVGYLMGYPALRLGGLPLVIATFGFTLVMQQAVIQWPSMTGGPKGFYVPRPVLGDFVFSTDERLYYLILVVTIILVIAARNIIRGKTGRALHAIRDSEIGAQSMGISLAKYKTTIFAISAFYAGVSGSLLGSVMGHIAPEVFNIWLSVQSLAVVIIGGLGFMMGSLIAGAFLVFLPEVLRVTGEWAPVIFGGAIVLCLLFMPKGIAGSVRFPMPRRLGRLVRGTGRQIRE